MTSWQGPAIVATTWANLRHPSAVRLLAFVAAVAGLFAAARDGENQPLLYLAFAAFLVASTLWVRGLDAHWVRREREPTSFVVLLLAFAVLVVATAVVRLTLEPARSTIILGGAIVAYIFVGLLVRRLRWVAADRPAGAEVGLLPVVLLGLLTALLTAYALLWRLGAGDLALVGLPLVAAVTVVPALVHVLSELIIRILSVPARDQARRVCTCVGLAVTALVAGAAIAAVDESVYLCAVLAVVALLAWALAVGSLVDIAVVIAVLALVGVTPGTQDVEPAVLVATPGPVRGQPEPVLVSLGDSYSSGEGAARYLRDTNVAGTNECRRAATAWPVLVAQALGAHRLVFRACSGARARHLVGRDGVDEQQAGEGVQVRRALEDLRLVERDLDPVLVVLSIGGNDSGFRQIGASCLSLGSCEDPQVSHLFVDNLTAVESALRATYLEVARQFPASPIAVMPYPDAFATDTGCARAPLEEGDVRFVRRFTGLLDATIEKVAMETGVYYVTDMRHALTTTGLALCDQSGTPGLNFLNLRGVGGTALDRSNPGRWIHNSLHPNERGHAALAAAFTDWLAQQSRGSLVGLQALLPAAAKRADDGVVEPADDLAAPSKGDGLLCFESGEGTCGSRADAWALSQIAPEAWEPLCLAALAAGGAWLLAVGSSAGRLRRRGTYPT